MAQYKKSQRCIICSQQTNGIFNPAKELIARLKTNPMENSDSDEEEEFGKKEDKAEAGEEAQEISSDDSD